MGLEAAHEKGLVHRDLKPANLRTSHTPEARPPQKLHIVQNWFEELKRLVPAESSKASP